MPELIKRIDEKVYELQKVTAIEQKKTHHCHQKTNCDTSSQRHNQPKVSLSSLSNASLIDAWVGEKNWWEGSRIVKSDGDRTEESTYHRQKKTNSDTSSQRHNQPKVSLSSLMYAAWIDGWVGEKNWWEGIRSVKCDGVRSQKNSPSQKRGLRHDSLRPRHSKSTPVISIKCGVD